MFSTLLSLALFVSAPSFAGDDAASPPSGMAAYQGATRGALAAVKAQRQG